MSVQQRVAALRQPLATRPFRRVWLAQIASDLGDAAGRIALAVLVTQDQGGPRAVGAVLAVSVLPYLGLGQWLTAKLECFPRVSVLVGADVLRAACYLAMAADLPTVTRFALLFVASACSPPFNSVRNALVPALLPASQVTEGFALQVLTNETARLVGLLLGGVAATIVSPETALMANAASFVLSGLLLWGIQADGAVGEQPREAARFGDGWRAIRQDRVVARIAWMAPAFVAFGSIPEALVVPFAEDELGRSGAVAGILAGLVSTSILVLAPLLRRPTEHPALVRQAATLALVGACSAGVLFVLSTNVVLVGAAYLYIGLVFVGRVNLGAAMSQRVDDSVRASSFSVVEGYVAVGQVLAGIGGGVAAEAFGTRATFVAAMAATATAGFFARHLPMPAHARVSRAATG